GAEDDPVTRRQLADVLATDVQPGTQRQTDGTPPGVAYQPGQRHPDMAVEELLVGRTRRRVVVDPGPLDLRPRAWRRRVVQAEQEAFAGHQDAHSQAQQQRGHYAGPWPQAAEEVIILAEVGAQAGRAQPAGHGAPTPGE